MNRKALQIFSLLMVVWTALFLFADYSAAAGKDVPAPYVPTGFPQVVADSHNPLQQCIACHRPHDPKPPAPPKGCEACHATIQRTLSVSHHGNLKCTTCHEVPKDHRLSPRGNPPKKLQTREACGACHAKGSAAAKDIPKVDLESHGGKYLCWECHYPHMPEAR